MELTVTEEHVRWAKLHGACEDVPEVGTPVAKLEQSQLLFADEHGVVIPKSDDDFSMLGQVPVWAMSLDGVGDGDGDGYGSGYGSGDGYGSGSGSGSGYGDGYGYGYGYGYGVGDGYGDGSVAGVGDGSGYGVDL